MSINKVKSQKYWILGKLKKGKFLIKCQNQKLKHIKRMDNNCHIPELIQTFPYVENDGLNLVL